jgi:hypothetical protein
MILGYITVKNKKQAKEIAKLLLAQVFQPKKYLAKI